MPRAMHPVLRQMLDRANPRVGIHVEVSKPDVEQVLRRRDQFLVDPPLVSPVPLVDMSVNAHGALTLTSGPATLAAQTTENALVNVGQEDPNKRLKALAWQPVRSFDRATLRTFKARVGRVGFLGGIARPFALQIYRAHGTPGVLIPPGYDPTRPTIRWGGVTINPGPRPFTHWTFTPLLPEKVLVQYQDLSWVSDRAWASFDLSPYNLTIERSAARDDRTPTQFEELPWYYFELEAQIGTSTTPFRWPTANGVTTVPNVGTFQRRWWVRDDPNEEWVEQTFNDTYDFELEVDEYVPTETAIYEVNLPQAPEAASTGRIVAEVIEPPGTSASVALSTAGSGGPWTILQDGDAVPVKQQNYHMRVVMNASASQRAAPEIIAFGVQYRVPVEVSRDADLKSPSQAVAPPYMTGSVGEGELSIIRPGRRDYQDPATDLGALSPTTKLEVEAWLMSDHPSVHRSHWFRLERADVSNRTPDRTRESLPLMSYGKRLLRKVPQQVESINTVHEVIAPTTAGAVTVTPNLAGVTGGGNEYDGQGYYIRVRSSSTLNPGYTHTIEGNTGLNRLDFIVDPLPGVLGVGDIIEVHSGKYAEAQMKWEDEDPHDVWWEILGVLGIPDARIGHAGIYGGGVPPTVAQRRPGDAAQQARLLISGSVEGKEQAGTLLDQISFWMGGATIEVDGQICFVRLYPERDEGGRIVIPLPASSFTLDPRDYVSLATPTGVEKRLSVLRCAYGVNYAAADPDVFPESEVLAVDADAVDWLTKQDLEVVGFGDVPDDYSRWCFNTDDGGLSLATQRTQALVSACSTGIRVWPVRLAVPRPDVVVGDTVTIITDQYTDYDPTRRRDIRGWYAYTGTVVARHAAGQAIDVFIPGLAAGAEQIRGGPGTLSGPGAPITPPVLTLTTVNVRSAQGVQIVIRASYTRPSTPYFYRLNYEVERSSDGGATWSAATLEAGTEQGNDTIVADWGLSYRIRPVSISTSGVSTRGSATYTIATGPNPLPTFDYGSAVADADKITYGPFSFGINTKYVEVWSIQTDAAGMSTAFNAPGATHVTDLLPGAVDGRTHLALPVDATNDYRITTFVPFDKDNNPGSPITVITQRNSAVTPPPPPTGGAGVSATATTVTVEVTAPNPLGTATQFRVYRNGVAVLDTAISVAAGGTQQIVVPVPTPNTSYNWQFSTLDSGGVESTTKTAQFSFSSAAAQVPQPQSLVVTRDAVNPCTSGLAEWDGNGAPDGTEWLLERSNDGGFNWIPYPITTTESMGISLQSGALKFRVTGKYAGWSDSLASSIFDLPAC